MVRRGDEIENPVTGERIVFRDTAQDTHGELLRFDYLLRPGGFVPIDHLHPRQEESFEIVSGVLVLRTSQGAQRLGPGERAVVPPGERHIAWNESDEEAHAIVEFRPALNIERFLAGLFRLAREGKVNARGRPRLLWLAVALTELPDHGYLPRLPIAVQKVALGALAPIGRLRGYRL